MHRHFLGTLVALGLLAVACGDDGDTSSSATGTTASSSAATTGSASAAGGSGGAPGASSAGGSGTMSGAGGCSGMGDVPFGDACECDEQCADVGGAQGVCFVFGMGAKCTIGCPADPMDCPNAGKGCNNKNPPVCKI